MDWWVRPLTKGVLKVAFKAGERLSSDNQSSSKSSGDGGGCGCLAVVLVLIIIAFLVALL
jgi:hypothetical protein